LDKEVKRDGKNTYEANGEVIRGRDRDIVGILIQKASMDIKKKRGNMARVHMRGEGTKQKHQGTVGGG